MSNRPVKTFISYHHKNDQQYKEAFVSWASATNLIDNRSVGFGEIDELADPQAIRRVIRDKYLRDTEVLVILCGTETRFRKHVDWEVKSAMIDGAVNRRSGILVLNLPSNRSDSWWTSGFGEKQAVYPNYEGEWRSAPTALELEEMFPDMPRRILDNLNRGDVAISVAPWDVVYGDVDRARFLLNTAREAGPRNQYDLTRKMRMRNFQPQIDHYDFRTDARRDGLYNRVF